MHPSPTYNWSMEILETSKFAKLADYYLDDEDLLEIKLLLAIKPDAGVVIPGSGGCRKLGGKDGGVEKAAVIG